MTKLTTTNIPFTADKAQIAKDNAIKNVTDSVQSNVIGNGKLVTGVKDASGRMSEGITVLAASPTTVYHGLGKQWKGWVVTRLYGLNSPALLWEHSTQGDGTETITIASNNDCIINLWVF